MVPLRTEDYGLNRKIEALPFPEGGKPLRRLW